jgi:hypothetical protein
VCFGGCECFFPEEPESEEATGVEEEDFERGEFGDTDPEVEVDKRLTHMRSGSAYVIQRTRRTGRVYEIQCWFTDQRLGTGTAALYDRAMTLSSAVGAVTLAGGEATNLGTLVQGPLSAPLDGDPDDQPALGGADVLFGSHCTGTFTRTSANDQLWLLVRGSHPIAANLLRSHLTAFQIRDVSPTWSSYGAGCGTVTLALGSLPAIGGTFTLNVANIGPGFPFLLTGVTQLNLPLPLPEFVPGCTALASPDLVDFLGVGGSTAAWSLAIPNNPALSGFQLFNQALEFGALLSLSNGGAATIR